MNLDIERRTNLSYAEFSDKYQYANKPVIVTDVLRQWKAMERWTPEFFKREFGDMKFSIDGGSHRSASYKAGNGSVEYTMERFIDQVLASTDENPAPYFRNQVLYEMFPSLRQDIEPLPEYFRPNWLPDRYLVKDVRNVLNRGAAIEIYIGGRGGKFPMLHYDGAAAHAFLMQIYGRKQFILYSPEQESFLYPSPEKGNLSLINSVDRPDLDKFPLFANAVPTIFVLEPGELLFIPSRWWHTTKMLTPCISISVNTVNQSNWPALINFVAAGRHNPLISLASRMYLTGAGTWRSWRDRDWGKMDHKRFSTASVRNGG
jgi:hypothetical protein